MNEVLSRLNKTAVIENGHLLRKEIIRFGKYQHPNPDFSSKKFDWNFDKAEAQKLIDNFDLGLVDSVKYLEGHDEEEGKILGNIVRLEMTKTGVDAVIDIVDEKLAKEHLTVLGDGKALRSGVSVGLDMKFRLSDSGTARYADGPVLRHVASVTIPWINGLRGFEKVSAAYPKFSMNFGHDAYDGIPVVIEEDFNEMTKDEAIKSLATAYKMDEEAVRKALTNLNNANKGKKKSKVNLEKAGLSKETVKFLEKIQESLNTDDDDEGDEPDDDDGDEDDDEGDNDNKNDNKNKNASRKTKRVKTRDPELEQALSQIREFSGVLTELAGGVAASREQLEKQEQAALERDAKTAVRGLIKAGKVLPAEMDTYVELYCENKDLFDKMTKNLETRVEFPDDVDYDDFDDNPARATNRKELSQAEVDEKTESYLKMAGRRSIGDSADSLLAANK